MRTSVPLDAVVSRRTVLGLGAAGLASLLLPGCGGDSPTQNAGRDGRLAARPAPPTATIAPGLHDLGLDAGPRDGVLYVPNGYDPAMPAPLLVLLHGAGGSARGFVQAFAPFADDAGLVVLGPDSRGSTWDVIAIRRFGPDVQFLDRALTHVFARCAIDPLRLALGGFSDGATYALSLGLTNGDLFSRLVAFSPGFAVPAALVGVPRVFVSHGVSDPILPIDLSSRRIVPQLLRAGYAVEYREFEGGHEIPDDIALAALVWLGEESGATA